MAALNASSWNLGKSLWPQKSIYDLLLKESPLLGNLKKDTEFGEDIRYIAVGSGAPQGVGPVFQIAKANKTGSLADVFQVTAKTYYALFSIDGRLLRKAKFDKAVIVKPYARESKNAILQWKRDISAFLFGNGGGAIGQLAAATNLATNSFVLRDTSKIRFFYRKMRLNSALTDGTTGTVNSGAMTVLKIAKSGPNKGTITIAEASIAAAIPAATVNDFIFREGVFGNVINGLLSWLPRADPGTTDPVTGQTVPGTFLNVDRTTDTEAYAGIRIDGTKMTPFNAFMNTAGAITDATGNADLYVLSTTDWQNLRNDTTGTGQVVAQYSPSSGIGTYKPGMKYTALELMGPGGPVKCVADPDCPVGRAFMLESEGWTLASTGELVSLIEGPMMEELADSWESRFVGDLELYSENPGHNATVQLSAAA